jgi:hypothetical protein
MTVVIFAGPSVYGLDIPSSGNIAVRPPAMQGDIFRACLLRPRAIGLIDGYFDGVPSVWHKEILWTLSQGIPVFGSASMGALRAAELDVFGMIGVGRIYQWYRDGVLEDDDEVALIHGPQETNYLPISEPMVNVRSTCEAAVFAGVLQQLTADSMVASAKHIHYQDRTWDGVLAAVKAKSAATPELAAFSQWKENGYVDQKRQDAVLLISEILRFLEQPKDANASGFHFEWTDLWDKAVHEWTAGHAPTDDSAAIINELRLDPELFSEISSRAVVRSILLTDADRRRVTVDRAAKLAALGRLREELDLGRKSDLDAWAKQNMLAEDGLDALIEEEARIDKVSQPVNASIERHIISILQSRGQYAALAKRAVDKRNTLQALELDQYREASGSLSPPVVLNWFFGSRHQQAMPIDFDRFVQNLGLSSRQDFYRLLADEYVYLSHTKSGDGGET